MPTILRCWGRRFYFYSSDGDEPPHVRVDHGGRTTKVWVGSSKVAHNDGCSMRELVILEVIDRHREPFLEAWREHFDD